MGRLKLLIPIFVCLLFFFLPKNVEAREFNDKIIWGQTFVLSEGESLNGNLVIMGGLANLEAGSRIIGNVIVFAGNLSADGLIEGSVFGVGGIIEINANAFVERDISTFDSVLKIDQDAQINGKVSDSGGKSGASQGMLISPFGDIFGSLILKLLWLFLRLFLLSTIAVFVALVLPNRVSKIASTLVNNPGLSGGVGIVLFVGGLLLILILAVTIIFSPLSLIFGLIFMIASMLGWISLGMELGTRISRVFKLSLSPGVLAGIGTFIVLLISFGIDFILGGIPCVSWILPVLITSYGLGGVALSWFGGKVYGLDE